MISILIPVYNSSVVNLVGDLSTQLDRYRLKGEIIVLDDCSDDVFRIRNRAISVLPDVNYKELDYNRGRVEIRKKLVSLSKFEWLLFIDGDSQLVRDNFLPVYYDNLKKDFDVITGGRVYASIPPEECSKRLHWQYGRSRETSAVTTRSRFHSNNFCIKKQVFNQLQFPGSLKGYGHEDTWIGMQLELAGIKINMIKNPVLHEGIECADVFLKKTDNALHNLLTLSKFCDDDLLQKHVRIFNVFYRVKRFRVKALVLLFFYLTKNMILSNLQSCNPSLVLFDLYRFGKLLEIDKDSSVE